MQITRSVAISACTMFSVLLTAHQPPKDQGADLKPNKSTTVTLRGYVRDLACLMKFHEALKPTNDCAAMCARAGSPLIIITKKNVIYTPISESVPDVSQRERLMPFEEIMSR
jgi:hypothetical protein